MVVITKKIFVFDLKIGMYVSRLDRPWAGTDYALEGFYIKTKDDIRRLISLCEHVYIDEGLSQVAVSRPKLTRSPNTGSGLAVKKTIPKRSANYTIKVRDQQHYQQTRTFKKEVKNAKKQHNDLKKSIGQFFNKITEQKIPHLDPIKKVVNKTIDSIVSNPDAMMWLVRTKYNDNYAYNFVLKQTIWALATARQVGMNKTDMEYLALASILSGIGKNKLPLALIKKEPNFNGKEFAIFKQHINHSINILQQMKNVPSQVIMAVENHCEYINGTGYPKGLSGNHIPITSQILGIAAFYESLSCPRDLSKAVNPNDAIDRVFEQRNKKFHTQLVEHFIQAIGIYPTGTLVLLDNGEVAVIVEQQESLRLTPQVMVLRDRNNNTPEKQKIIDLRQYKDQLKIQQSLPVGAYGIENQEIVDAVLDLHNSWNLKSIIGF